MRVQRLGTGLSRSTKTPVSKGSTAARPAPPSPLRLAGTLSSNSDEALPSSLSSTSTPPINQQGVTAVVALVVEKDSSVDNDEEHKTGESKKPPKDIVREGNEQRRAVGGEREKAWSRFENLETIGAGAFGTAYLVRSRNKGDGGEGEGGLYVVKRMYLKGPDGDAVLKAAATEVNVLQLVPPHPNIVAYIDHFIDDEGYLNLVMEYCPGGDLEQLIEYRCCSTTCAATDASSTSSPQAPPKTHNIVSRDDEERASVQTGQTPKPFSLEEVLFIAFQLLAAVRHLHSLGIVHRDLKPANIFLCGTDLSVSKPREHSLLTPSSLSLGNASIEDRQKQEDRTMMTAGDEDAHNKGRDGGPCFLTHKQRVAKVHSFCRNSSVTGLTLKIADFGIARILETTNAAAKTVIGTPFYISPQQCNGDPYTAAADVWALGCIIYEVASGTGQRCFPGNNMLAVVKKVCSGVVPHLSDPSMDAMIRPLLLGMLCPEDAMRLTAAQCLHEFFYTSDPDFADEFEDPSSDED